ncbi:FAD-dependent monooxygenase [Streptomyces sp. NBC_01317]|uniref:FAD-dependent monooxygenase n=1 Tax=Streptomyces sp. NBC_01317 TaxID=2903822 RepID=UPI002E13BB89
MNDDPAVDVLIVGAGPTGTALAIDLARRGHSLRVIDKSPHAFDGSRAKGIQPRSLEVLEDLGALDDILAGGSGFPLLGVHLGPVTVPWRMVRNARAGVDVPYPSTWLIPQFRTDRALRARLESLGRRVEFGTELVELVQGPGAVTADVAGPDGIERIVARYVVGADGGSSRVRKQLAVEFAGATGEQDRMLLVDAATSGLSRDRWHVWPGAGGRFVGACPLPYSDLFQWMIRPAQDEEPPGTEARINERVRSHTGNRRIALTGIRWTSVFRPNIRLAESYRRGRVFLAGDAAHVHTPAGAQGLNTGLQDAYNLGWKLSQVLAGADDALLDSYEAERLPLAESVLNLSTKKYEGIAKLDPSSIRRGKDEQQLALTYHGGPLAARAHSDATKKLRVGDRAPDSRLAGRDGRPVRLFDLYQGPHFTAPAYGSRAGEALDRLEWPEVGAPLTRIVFGKDAGHAKDAEHAHHRLTDPRRTTRRVYGLTEDTLLVIRPDGYIGHNRSRLRRGLPVRHPKGRPDHDARRMREEQGHLSEEEGHRHRSVACCLAVRTRAVAARPITVPAAMSVG